MPATELIGYQVMVVGMSTIQLIAEREFLNGAKTIRPDSIDEIEKKIRMVSDESRTRMIRIAEKTKR